MVLYADLLVAGNALTDYILLRICAAACHEPVHTGRMTAASLIGGASAMLITAPRLWATVGAAVAGAMMCAVAFATVQPRKLTVRSLCLYGAGLVWSGVWYAVWFLLHPNGVFWQNGYVYFDVSPLQFIGITVGAYAALRVIHGLRRSAPRTVRFSFFGNGRTVYGHALLDSGNLLTEPVSGLPVIVADRALTEPIFPPLDPADDPNDLLVRAHFRLIRYDSVGGGGLLPACRIERVRAEEGRLRPSAELYVAACPELRKNTGYDAIFPETAFVYWREKNEKRANPSFEEKGRLQ